MILEACHAGNSTAVGSPTRDINGTGGETGASARNGAAGSGGSGDGEAGSA